MTTDDFTTAARAEAERRWPYSANPDPTLAEAADAALNAGFMTGTEWARDYHAAQEPTDAETGHAYAEWMNHSPISDLDARRLNCDCGARGFTPSGYEHHRLRAALSAARAVGRDAR